MITTFEKHAVAEHELKMCQRVYPGWVAKGRMTQAEADHQIRVMEAIASDYAAPDLFATEIKL